MGTLQTAERSSSLDPSENVIFQRHLIAYKEAAKLINGIVLEIGSGEGYGIEELARFSSQYIAIDKFQTSISNKLNKEHNITFIQSEVPPLDKIDTESIDFVVTFQVIEHIQDDKYFLKEIHRVLKPGGKLILTTPNKNMSLSRNPWHIREYNPKEMLTLLQDSFNSVDLKGVFGNEKVMLYYEKNKKSVEKIMRFDLFNMQYWLPRWILQIPYDILNRFNRQILKNSNVDMVSKINISDYIIKETSDTCLDHFCILTK